MLRFDLKLRVSFAPASSNPWNLDPVQQPPARFLAQVAGDSIFFILQFPHHGGFIYPVAPHFFVTDTY